MEPNEYKYMYDLEDCHCWFVSRRNLVIHLIRSLKMPSPIILDVGTATGGNLLSLSSFGESIGIDISKKAIEFCKKRGLKNAFQCPVEKIYCDDKTFDIVTCIDLLEHLSDPVEALIEMRRVLKDTGKLIITVPVFKIIWSQHDEMLHHLRRYEKHMLSYHLDEAGLKIDKIGYFFFTSFFVVALVRIMRRFFVSRQKMHSDITSLPPKIFNEFLKLLFNTEIRILDTFKLPFGTTLYTIVSKEN